MKRFLTLTAAAALLVAPANAQSFKQIKERGTALGFITAGFCALQNGDISKQDFIRAGNAQNYSKATFKWLEHPKTAEMATKMMLEYDCDIDEMARALRSNNASHFWTPDQLRHMGWKF